MSSGVKTTAGSVSFSRKYPPFRCGGSEFMVSAFGWGGIDVGIIANGGGRSAISRQRSAFASRRSIAGSLVRSHAPKSAKPSVVEPMAQLVADADDQPDPRK